MKKLTIIAILCLVLPLSAFANREECNRSDIKIINQNILLQAQSGTIFYIENRSAQDLWLDRAKKSAGASAGWASQLQPRHWSNLVVNKNFMLSCSNINANKLRKLNCAEVLNVCKIGMSNNTKVQGSYWMKENQRVNRMGR